MIPKTTTYKQFKEKKAKEAAKTPGVEKGQRTLNGNLPAGNKANGDSKKHDESAKEGDKPSISGPSITLMVDRTVDTQAGGNGQENDVEMTDE